VKITYSKTTNTSWGNPAGAVLLDDVHMNSNTKQACIKIN
jgi:hypothetical protein